MKKKIISAILALGIIGQAVTGVVNAEITFEEYTFDQTLYTSLKDGTAESVLSQYNKNDIATKFSDVDIDSWYIDYLILPIHYNVLNGYGNGTLKPNNNITAGEVAKVVLSAYKNTPNLTGTLSNKEFGESWYNYYYNEIAEAFTYTSSNDMDTKYMNSPMRRCEIAYVLAKFCDDGTLDSYIKKAEQGDLSQMLGFSDFNNVVISDGTLANERNLMNEGKIPARFAGAVMYLNAKGIMAGHGDGTIGALANVTRAQVFKLIQDNCKNTKSYESGKFAGTEFKLKATDQDILLPEPGTYNPGSSYGFSGPDNSGYTGTEAGFEYETYDEWQARPPMIIYASDTGRKTRAKCGDTFVTEDGKSYYLEHTGIYMNDGVTEVAGVGLPIAMDLGRVYSYKGRQFTVTNYHVAVGDTLGQQSKSVTVNGRKYIVFKTGEGHWQEEWGAILNATRPTQPGTQDGQVDSTGYWVWRTELGRWSSQVRI